MDKPLVTIPGLAQQCSPVVDVDDERDVRGIIVQHPCVTQDRPRISVFIYSIDGQRVHEYRDASHPCHYALDLDHPVGIQHAADYIGLDLPAWVAVDGSGCFVADADTRRFDLPRKFSRYVETNLSTYPRSEAQAEVLSYLIEQERIERHMDELPF